jgi:hypothetical protein
MTFANESWHPQIDWETPAGRLLDLLVKALPADREWRIIVFGSSPLQLGVDSAFLSGDVDVIPLGDIEPYCKTAGLLEGQRGVYLEICMAAAFLASSDWMTRACELRRSHVIFILPHPLDILVSKVKRLDPKDLAAFKLVITKTGHPTEEELRLALQRVVDIYRPNFDEESKGDPWANTVRLWQELYQKSIDVSHEIVAPALAERRKSYGGRASGAKNALKRLGEME